MVQARMRGLVAAFGREGAAAWLTEALASVESDLARVRVMLARCSRKVGDTPLAAQDLPGWTARDAARCALVLRAFEVSEQAPEAFGPWLRRGEQGEQVSLLRMLPLLPTDDRLVSDAIDACRTNSEVVFRAIACRNPFPASRFPDANFNQLVLKAIFVGVPVAEIHGLAERVTPQLLRMADDFAAERTAAGRPVPDDVAFLHQLFEAPR